MKNFDLALLIAALPPPFLAIGYLRERKLPKDRKADFILAFQWRVRLVKEA
jgi:hypothetical protein